MVKVKAKSKAKVGSKVEVKNREERIEMAPVMSSEFHAKMHADLVVFRSLCRHRFLH
jgi:hypothetical protein